MIFTNSIEFGWVRLVFFFFFLGGGGGQIKIVIIATWTQEIPISEIVLIPGHATFLENGLSKFCNMNISLCNV